MLIRAAETDGDYEAVGMLIREYVAWCRSRYRELPGVMDMAFSHQSIEQELAGLATAYGPPAGKTLVAVEDGAVLGCVAYRVLSAGTCEMKRLFVPERFHGRGIGRRLASAIVTEAERDGFTLMRLDTGHLFTEAQRLHRSIGFADCAPYHDYPPELAGILVFMEMALPRRPALALTRREG